MSGDFDDLFDDDFDDGYASTKSGMLEVLPGGWGFLRQNPGASRRQDIYVPQAQIYEASLKSGDIITGHVRPPKETERYSVLLRVRSINGKSHSFL